MASPQQKLQRRQTANSNIRCFAGHRRPPKLNVLHLSDNREMRLMRSEFADIVAGSPGWTPLQPYRTKARDCCVGPRAHRQNPDHPPAAWNKPVVAGEVDLLKQQLGVVTQQCDDLERAARERAAGANFEVGAE